ncbi:hypothetical protein DFH11DRAFT_1676540, partial [Phellopilus nigrolimitatus]
VQSRWPAPSNSNSKTPSEVFFPRDVAKCRQFLRHKSFLASTTLLARSSCKPNKLVQH